MGKGILKKAALYLHTVRYLRWEQISYRIYYMLRRRWRWAIGFQYALARVPVTIDRLQMPILEAPPGVFIPKTAQFKFLNQTYIFGEKIGWGFKGYGKLWQYNLHYFEYLLQADIGSTEGRSVIEDFIHNLSSTPEALEPYPTALRLMYWTQFLSKYNLDIPEINASLCAQAYILKDNLEYHILANHVLENGFGLLFAAYYCRDSQLYVAARKILKREISEQILADGGHYERSPMYHQLILRRMLDTYALLKYNPPLDTQDGLLEMVTNVLPQMLAWMLTMTFPNDAIARFNDSVAGIAPAAESLLEHARELGLVPSTGINAGITTEYWCHTNETFKVIADVGSIGPSYQPGHAHCNALGIECYIYRKPAIVNTGISTYEKNVRRQYERSTAAHNTVQIGNWEQSEMWGGFRVGRRVKPKIEQFGADQCSASHTGYGHWPARHRRSVRCNKAYVQIEDTIVGRRGQRSRAYFHCPPGLVLEKKDNVVHSNLFCLHFQGFLRIIIEQYAYCQGFNQLVEANRIVVEFDDALQTTLTPNLKVKVPI